MSHNINSSSPPPIPKRLVKTALHQAVLDGRLHQVRLLVAKHGVNVDCKDVYGRTPVMLTSMVEEDTGSKMARILIAAGTDLSVRDNMGRTALALACMNGREKIVDEILRKDILNINEPDNDRSTPLHHAATSGNPNIVRLLSELFSKFALDIDTRNNLGYTALLLACRNGHFVSAYHLLVKGNASPSLRDGETFLNALEWTQKSARHVSLPVRRIHSPPSAPAFSRESTMYQKVLTPMCNLSKAVPTFQSWGRDDIEFQRHETFLDGKDARQLVIHELNHTAETHGWPNKPKKQPKTHHSPPTAKLLALSRRRTKSAQAPDMSTIFKIYSEQYQPDWRREKTTLGLAPRKSIKVPSIARTVPSSLHASIEVKS